MAHPVLVVRDHLFRSASRLVFLAVIIYAAPNGYSGLVGPDGRAMARWVNSDREELKPARAAFQRGDVDLAKTLLALVSKASDSLPHEDVQLAVWHLQAGNRPAAIETLERVALVDPEHADVRYAFAEIAIQDGRYFDAWSHLDVAKDAAPRKRWSKQYAAHLATVVSNARLLVAERRGDWQSVRELSAERLKREPRLASHALSAGRAEFQLGEPDEAIKYFRTAARLDDQIIPELVLSELHQASGDSPSAESWLRQGLANESGKRAETVRLRYVRWLLKQNRAADAREYASLKRPSKDNLETFQYMIAMADRMQGHFAEAEAILDKLHQADKDNFQVSNQLALTLIESDDEGKRGRAMHLASRNYRRYPNNIDSVSSYAWVLHRLGDSSDARQIFNRILRGGQASRDVAFYVSRINTALGKESEAKVFLEAARQSKGEFFNQFRAK